jgi:hypothetical protein
LVDIIQAGERSFRVHAEQVGNYNRDQDLEYEQFVQQMRKMKEESQRRRAIRALENIERGVNSK